jgi:hypothetical protein
VTTDSPFNDENPIGKYPSQWGVVVNALRVVSISEGEPGEVRLEPQDLGGWRGSVVWPVHNEDLPNFRIGQRYIVEGLPGEYPAL